MIELFIDNRKADIDATSEVSISLSVASLTSPWLGRAGYSKSIFIPATPLNRMLMGDCEQPLTSTMFNHSLHTARVEALGSVIIEGTVFLTASKLGRGGYYRFNIVGNAREWIKGAAVPLRELFAEWSATFDEPTIKESFTPEQGLVKFFPVARGRFRGRENYHNRLLPTDLHPFLNIRQLIDAMLAQTGYVVESEFMDSEFFRSLYMSGRLSTRPLDEDWAGRMAFVATKRQSTEEVASDEDGRIYADPFVVGNSVGEVVDLPDGEAGSKPSEAFGRNAAGRLCFTPTKEVNVAFEYYLRYVTEYTIESRTRLRGHTLIHTEFGDIVEVELPNRFVDKRGEPLTPNLIYSLAIFDLPEGAVFRLLGRTKVADGWQTLVLHSTSERVSNFAIPENCPIENVRLEYEQNGLWFSFVGDWAIYNGNVAERGLTRVEVAFRSKPNTYSPDKPKYFDMLYFDGADAGAKFMLLEGCSVRPIFHPHHSVGDTLSWCDIADYSTTGMELLAALRDMFDLQIYTDPLDKKVCIEPRRDYCDKQVVIDFSDRIDLSQGVVVEELGGDCCGELQVCYQRGDAAAQELSNLTQREYGSWSATIDNKFASKGRDVVRNGIFAPSVSACQLVDSAPSMWLLRVGDVEQLSDSSLIDNLNFSPKIVSFRGMATLPDGQKMGYPANVESRSYPLATFFDDGSISGKPLSLLMEDCQGVEGLHSYWDYRVGSLNHSRRLTLYLRLYPDEVEQIVVPNSTKHDFRAHYLLRIAGDEVLCRMEEIVDYNPSNTSTKVVLVTV
ncbi:MAG: hypothetical protein J6R10_06810 [Tidjanibacter sp.]|nr:hypothetical protein [Tidjanibacter sp.]